MGLPHARPISLPCEIRPIPGPCSHSRRDIRHSAGAEHQGLCPPVRGPLGRTSRRSSPPVNERGRRPESAEKRDGVRADEGHEGGGLRRQPSTAGARRERAETGQNGGCRRNARWGGRAKGGAETSSMSTSGGGKHPGIETTGLRTSSPISMPERFGWQNGLPSKLRGYG